MVNTHELPVTEGVQEHKANDKENKKLFIKRLCTLSLDYHNEMIAVAATKAAIHLDDIWKLIKCTLSVGKSGVSAEKNR